MFSIIGNGHWGSAIAAYLAKTYPVELIGRRKKTLPSEIVLPQKTSLAEAAYDHWIYAGPTQVATSVLMPRLGGKGRPKTCIIASKGLIENAAGNVVTLADYLSTHIDRVAMLSGPSFANELIDGKPTFLVGATKDVGLANDMHEWFSNEPIQLSLSQDVIGVSFAGAFKNPIAILIGYLDCIFMSANMRFAVITHVNQVLSELLHAIGADPSTAYGVAGQGDLCMTCSVDQSRNRQMGQLLAKGYCVDDAKKTIGSMVEGLSSLNYLKVFCDQNKIQVPLIALISDLVYGDLHQDNLLSRMMSVMQLPTIRIQETLDI